MSSRSMGWMVRVSVFNSKRNFSVLPMEGVGGGCFMRVKVPVCETDHLPLIGIEAKNGGSLTSAPCMSLWRPLRVSGICGNSVCDFGRSDIEKMYK